MKTTLRTFALPLLAILPTLPAAGQVHLNYSIPAPPVGVQAGAQLGQRVAVDGGYAVVGVPHDDIGATVLGDK